MTEDDEMAASFMVNGSRPNGYWLGLSGLKRAVDKAAMTAPAYLIPFNSVSTTRSIIVSDILACPKSARK